MLKNGVLIAYDSSYAENEIEENEIIEKILKDDFAWSEAINNSENFNDFNKVMPNSIFKK